MRVNPAERSQLVELAQTEGYKLLKEHFNKQIQSKINGLVSQDFQDLSKIASLQAEIRAIRKVFDFVEQSKGE